MGNPEPSQPFMLRCIMDTRLLAVLYETTNLTQREIAARLGIGGKRVWSYCQRHYTKQYRDARHRKLLALSKQGAANPMWGKVGDAHHNYVGLVSDNKGYWMVLKPSWYTGRTGSKHVFAHSVAASIGLGVSQIPRGWCVHHCDENPANNAFDNLVVLRLGDHQKVHAYVRSLEGVSTISKESTLKWAEAQGLRIKKHDIVSAVQQCTGGLVPAVD